MFFYHGGTQSVCAGKTLALCVAADFCQQMSPVSRNSEQNNPVSGKTTPVPSIFDEVTPASRDPKEDIPQSDDRIQRTLLAGTRPPSPLVSTQFRAGREEVFFAGPGDHTDNRVVSWLVKAF